MKRVFGPLALGAAALLGAAGAVNLMTPATAQQDLSRAEVETIVREYLIENPDVIIEALQAYEQRSSAEAQARAEDEIRSNLPALMQATAGHPIGASVEAADVLVVEFFDYHCGYCKQSVDFVFDLADEFDDLRIVFKELPVVHQASREVALASLAVAGTDDYVPLHRALMGASGIINESRLNQIAREANIDTRALAEALSDEDRRAEIEAKLAQSMDMARSFAIQGTPGFIIASPDGQFVEIIPGYAPELIRDAVERARAI